MAYQILKAILKCADTVEGGGRNVHHQRGCKRVCCKFAAYQILKAILKCADTVEGAA